MVVCAFRPWPGPLRQEGKVTGDARDRPQVPMVSSTWKRSWRSSPSPRSQWSSAAPRDPVMRPPSLEVGSEDLPALRCVQQGRECAVENLVASQRESARLRQLETSAAPRPNARPPSYAP